MLKNETIRKKTPGTPVSNATELKAMAASGEYYLTQDIDLGTKKWTALHSKFKPEKYCGRCYWVSLQSSAAKAKSRLLVFNFEVAIEGGGRYVGGLVGSNTGAGTVTGYATGDISGVISVGGLVGKSSGGTVKIANTSKARCLVGKSSGGTVKGYARGSVKCTEV